MRHRARPLIAPALLWLAHFVAVYALASLACAWGPDAPMQPPTFIFASTALLTAGALALSIVGVVRNGRALRGDEVDDQLAFLSRTGLLLYGLASIGIAWVALPGLLLPGCD